jgi:hypothetical protein
MRSLCTSHYRYNSLQYYRGSNFGTDGNVTEDAKAAVCCRGRDNWKALLSLTQFDAIQFDTIQPDTIPSDIIHFNTRHNTRQLVRYATARQVAAQYAGSASCLSDSNISMNYLASRAVASAPVDSPVEFRERVGRTASGPTWH